MRINVQQVESKSGSDFCDRVQVKVSLREEKIEPEKKRPGRFIFATNIRSDDGINYRRNVV
ncbi:MAG: hypothetical protein F6K17_30750 [Okeania sp. SIO3C4]|nr:hypothetical protein [Okeania sp. SIO3B3]NER06649.1 hypothetical protein [Okeania sp. SIO3C4]